MSLHLNFEPHSWYMGFAIKKNGADDADAPYHEAEAAWEAYTADGNTYRVVDFEAKTLERLKSKIRQYHLRKHNGYGERIAKQRLESIRDSLRIKFISYGELAELEGLKQYIAPDDVELLEAAGVPERTR